MQAAGADTFFRPHAPTSIAPLLPTQSSLPLACLVQVQDESGCYVPVGFMVASAETEEMYECFLRTLLKGVSWVWVGKAEREG